ncbi:hypothetical protein RRF68_04885 [Tenacibaculum sp. HL-MS23]|uniref:hypothetical protein n=1 Tax=Tenacibaculum sp. HL-MS23 TaxID=3077734 RepID=UPI0028FC13D0|nr:hypothetical protein [Tenacibaculum sp. HL-MS23]WNW02748.1 hypothetical protein RRF68_04885 [Tenacibaculum sp. HL-MS23]
MKTLGKYIKDEDLLKLSQLLNKRIWFIRSPFLGANLREKTYTAVYFQIPFFWKNEIDIEQSKNFEFRSEWNEDEETLLDYYNLEINIAEQEKFEGDFESIWEQSLQKGLNSSISFSEFIISEILILSREEIIDELTEIKHDEGLLLIDKDGEKILLSAEIKCTGQVEFINDLTVIENRIIELKIRKTLGNTV